MAEKKDSGVKSGKEFDPDTRFRYVGFEVYTGKIKDLFKSDVEKQKLVEAVREKRKRGIKLREKTSFDIPLLAGYEKIVLTAVSILMIISLFLPWFSGYREYEVAVTPTTTEQQAVTSGGSTSDGVTAGAAKDDRGFSSITSAKKHKEVRKESRSVSALSGLALSGKMLSSGFILKLTWLLFLVYVLSCIGSALYTLYTLYVVKGDPDAKVLKLKRVLRLNWIPVCIWGFCMLISLIGASYSFDTSNMVKQLGKSYGISAYLGLLGYGFYLSLAGFIMNGVKSVEI